MQETISVVSSLSLQNMMG